MDKRNKILNHDLFIKYYADIEAAELDRKFCRHNIVHFLDVARLAKILNMEEQIGVEEELIYAAALLHDIGRMKQYEDGTPHEQESARIAPEILKDCGFSEKETTVIVEAILKHRTEAAAEEKNLNGLLYRADKLSRSCYFCKVSDECKWKQGGKNKALII